MSDGFEGQDGGNPEPVAVEQDAPAGADAGGEQAAAPAPVRIDWSDPEKATEAAFDAMADIDVEAADDLRLRWGPLAPQKLQAARAFAQANPDIVKRLAVLGNQPELIEAAANLGEQYLRQQQDGQRVMGGSMDDLEDQIADLREQRNKALNRLDHRKAERIDRQMKEMYGRVAGSKPAVGTGMRWA